MNRIDPDIDIISDLLKAVLASKPNDAFCASLLVQYQERGGLSKKQLEGLLGKATKFTDVPQGKLATLEAIIKKKHTRHRSEKPVSLPPDDIDIESPALIEAILQKYPAHKRVLYFRLKLEKQEMLSQQEKDELKKFAGLLLRK